MPLGRLYALIRTVVELNSIRVLAAVIAMMHEAGHPSFGDPYCEIDLNGKSETEIAAIDVTCVQADALTLYCIAYFSGDFRDITTDYRDWLTAFHTIGEWAGWEAELRDTTEYGVGRYAEIRARIWGDPVPTPPDGVAGPSVGLWQIHRPAGTPYVSPGWKPSPAPVLVEDGPVHTAVPELIDLSIASLQAARIALEKVIGSPDRPIRAVAAFTTLADLIVDLTAQAAAARTGAP